VLLLAGWKGWQHFQAHSASGTSPGVEVARVPPESSRTTAREARPATPSFRCDGRQYCSQMTSRAEAEFFVRNCPDTKMDGDRDGIPCEKDSRF